VLLLLCLQRVQAMRWIIKLTNTAPQRDGLLPPPAPGQTIIVDRDRAEADWFGGSEQPIILPDYLASGAIIVTCDWVQELYDLSAKKAVVYDSLEGTQRHMLFYSGERP